MGSALRSESNFQQVSVANSLEVLRIPVIFLFARLVLQSAESARITIQLGQFALVPIISVFLLLKSASKIFLCLTIPKWLVNLGQKGNLERPYVKRIWLKRKGRE